MSTTYTIVKPKKIVKSNIEISNVPKNSYLVKTKITQVCDADAKYYYGLKPKFPYSLIGFKYFFGIRDKENLNNKYPLIPIHEAIGIIEKVGAESSLKENTRVVLIPTISCAEKNCKFCNSGNENYCRNSKFMSSNAPGFARDYSIQVEKNVAKIPDEVPDEIAIFTEMSTVAYGAIVNANVSKDDSIVIFGDGCLAYVLAVLLSNIFRIDKKNLWVFGKYDKKLSIFEDFSTTVNILKTKIPKELYGSMTKAFECVGKRDAKNTIEYSIKLIRPGGILILLGVSEERVRINTRDVLSKNITIKGLSRSPAKYFPIVLEKMKDKKLQNMFKKIPIEKIKIKSVNDIKRSLKNFMTKRKKLLMDWD